jgi:TolA-binding protein
MREDAARMRVNRGLEKLREFFTKRGVTLSAAAIAGAVSANSVQAAPVGLAATITATALSGTTITTATVIVASKAIAMTILQKTVIAATVAVLAGAGIYEAYEAAQLREQNQTLQQQQAGQIQQLQLERDEMAQKLATLTEQNQLLNSNATELLRLRGELAGIRSAANSGEKSRSAEVAMKSWLNRVKEFKRLPIRLPDKTIPELQLLTEEDWLELAKEPLEHNPNEINLEDDSTARLVLSSVRVRAKQKLTGMMVRALNKYVEANDGLLPTDTLQLKPYFVKTFFIEPGHVGEVIDASVDDAILQRYGILQTGKLEAVSSDALIIAENAPVDTQFDTRVEIGRGWMAVEDEVGAYSNNLGARASNEPTNK